MKHYILCILFSFLSISGYAKGSAGEYYIKGIAYGKDMAVLANTTIAVRIGNEVREVETDHKGQFEIEIPWVYPCRSAISHSMWVDECKRLNPEFIYIQCGNVEIKIKNEWQKYTGLYKPKEEVTKHEDLIFL